MRVILVIVVLLALPGPWCPQVSAAGPDTAPSGLPLADLGPFVDAYVADHLGTSTPGLAVVVVKDGEIILSKGYGYADVAQGVRVDPAQTVFEYGSVSKLFVYTTLMLLVEQGRLDLTADIRATLPVGFLRRLRFEDPITLLHVMSHTTGFEDVLFDVVLTPPGPEPGLEETLRALQPEQVYRPGTVSAYSNYAVALAAWIAQRALGQDLHAYLLETVFTPLQMDSTSAHPTLDDRPDLLARKAAGYAPDGRGSLRRAAWSYIPLYPVGSVNGTAEDLARFAMALMPAEGESGPLFERRETLDEMLTQSYAMGPGLTGFAHGFIEWDGPVHAMGHGGNTAFFSAQMNIVPEERFGVIVLANAAGEMALTGGLTDALIGWSPDVYGKPVAGEGLPAASQVEGTYIQARRPHNSFLKVYPYLSLLRVSALGPAAIRLSTAGQSGDYVQTAPYVYERVSSDGVLFAHQFRTIYFQMANGRVERISGDLVPLPAFHTRPWLLADLLLAALSALFLLLAPVGLGIAALWRRRREEGGRGLPHVVTGLLLCGTGLVVNDALLAVRMLTNNYRSWIEMRPQVLLNYPLALGGVVLGVLVAVRWRSVPATGGKRRLAGVALGTVLAVGVVLALMLKWGFFDLLY
ncbi:MAG: serine hydrolase domain-containing protein [Anaerolineae bacterium]